MISYFQAKYVFDIKNSIEKKIFKSYLTQDYSSFMKVNSSRRINNLILKTQNVVEGAFIPIMVLIAEILVLISICVLLLTYNFKITILAVTVLLSITLFSIFILKPLFKKWGN